MLFSHAPMFTAAASCLQRAATELVDDLAAHARQLGTPERAQVSWGWGAAGELLGSCWVGSCWGAAGELLGSCWPSYPPRPY